MIGKPKQKTIRSLPGQMCEFCHMHRTSITVEERRFGKELWTVSCPCRTETATAGTYEKVMKKWRE